jgi:class 3 adenylate cyclase
MAGLQRKSLLRPDEQRSHELATTALTRLGTHVIGRGVLEPGWRWSTHMGALMGTSSCPIHHVQITLSGQFAVRMDDGEEIVLQPYDVVDIPPGHDAWVVGDEPAVLIDIAGNIASIGVPREHERMVTTILFTDIVDSTTTAERLGDTAWKQVLADHDQTIRVLLDRYRGTEVHTTGDGFLATFISAASAFRCAVAIRDAVRSEGLEVRIGIHAGEVELVGTNIAGLNVHAAARIMALAGRSQILASSIARGLVDGSGLSFVDFGRHGLKGLERPLDVVELVAATSS